VTEVAKLSKEMGMIARWYAVYTRSRWEKKVVLQMAENGITCYCPLNRVTRKWSDRIKSVEEPLFKSYVFVKVTDKQRTAVRMISGVVNFVYWQGKPAIIKEKEINRIKMFLDEYENVQVEEMAAIKVGQRVKILSGVMMDYEGKVMNVNNKKVKVAIDSLGYILVAYIERKKLTSLRH